MIGQALLTPCMVVLLVIMTITVWQVGNLLVELLIERRKVKADVPVLIKRIHEESENLSVLIEESSLLNRQKQMLHTLIEARGLPRTSMIALAQRLLATEEAWYGRVTIITDTAARMGPMLGLLGTLIPLGPGIVALGEGDTATLAKSMGIAFDTTIAGLAIAVVCMIISNIRKRWYDDYMVSMESIMDCILEEVAPDGAK